MSEVIVVLTNLPDQATADALAARLVEGRLAACVNVLVACRSTYRWQGRIEHGMEVPMLIKTTRAHYAAVEQAILDQHGFGVPEIIALPVTQGLPAYLDWVAAETGKR